MGATLKQKTTASPERIAAAVDQAVIEPASTAAIANSGDRLRRKLTSYLWRTTAKDEVEKGKVVLRLERATSRCGQV